MSEQEDGKTSSTWSWGGIAQGLSEMTDLDALSGKESTTKEEEEEEEDTPPDSRSTNVSSALLSTAFSAVSNTFDLDALVVESASATPRTPTPFVRPRHTQQEPSTATDSTSIWSSALEAMPSATSTVTSTVTSTTSSMLNFYSANVNKASEWIQDLQHEAQDKDPHSHLKEHLNHYLTDVNNPRGGKYEEWIQLWIQEQGWDDDDDDLNEEEEAGTSKPPKTSDAPLVPVLDYSYYQEESIHRNLWNERNYQDGIGIDEKYPQRKYIPSRNSQNTRTKTINNNNCNKSEPEEETITFEAVDEGSSEKNVVSRNSSFPSHGRVATKEIL